MATGGLAFNPRRRRRPPRAFVGSGGGVGSRPPRPKPYRTSPGLGAFPQPPFLTYNPEIEAKRRAAERGLEDTEQDFRTKLHFGRTDLHQALRDIKVGTTRKREDIGREAERGRRKLNYAEADSKLRAARANQDFDRQLATIGRQFADLGQRQREGANAAGVLDSGTMAAASAARGRNQRTAEEPIGIARQRTAEDLYTALSRIQAGRGELGQDTVRAYGRLGQDTGRERKLAGRQFGRERFEGKREVGRARREQAIGNVDLLTQEIYSARAEHPAAFGAFKGRNPGALKQVKTQNAGKPQKRRRR